MGLPRGLGARAVTAHTAFTRAAQIRAVSEALARDEAELAQRLAPHLEMIKQVRATELGQRVAALNKAADKLREEWAELYHSEIAAVTAQRLAGAEAADVCLPPGVHVQRRTERAVTDVNLLPRSLLVPDMKLVRAAGALPGTEERVKYV